MADNTREKLVELMGEAMMPCDDCANCQECSYFPVQPCADYLVADHMIANGVTVLPCKLGDTVWGIRRCNLGNAVKQGVVYQMYFGEDMRLCICVKNVCRGEWGVNVFATQAEAEEALRRKERERG